MPPLPPHQIVAAKEEELAATTRTLEQEIHAVEKGCPRLQWEVLDWNTPAVDFYRAMGAEFLDEWRNVRISGEALQRLAGTATGAVVNDLEAAK